MLRKLRNNCIICGEEVKHVKSTCCSSKCSRQLEYTSYITRWKAGLEKGSRSHGEQISNYVKRYFMEKYNSSCQLCGWNKISQSTHKCPLTLHHINGISNDNTEENLQLLCPCCHALTPTYGGANKGKGRSIRRNKLSDKSVGD